MPSEINTRVYVVETPGKCVQCGNLPYHRYDTVKSCCIYSPDSPVHGDPEWVSVHTTEDHTDAVHVAKEYPRARVRQFWVARQVTQRDTLKPTVDVIIPEASLVDMTCMDHPEVKLRWLPDGDMPAACSICHKPLVTQAVVDAMANPIDLSET